MRRAMALQLFYCSVRPEQLRQPVDITLPSGRPRVTVLTVPTGHVAGVHSDAPLQTAACAVSKNQTARLRVWLAKPVPPNTVLTSFRAHHLLVTSVSHASHTVSAHCITP